MLVARALPPGLGASAKWACYCVTDPESGKDGVTMLPGSAGDALLAHLGRTREPHQNDLRKNLGQAPLPGALLRKHPNADREWGWQYVFPASSHYADSATGIRHRHHLLETVIQKAVHGAFPAAASEICARAYSAYRTRRKADSGKHAPPVPLPDFYIGATRADHGLVAGDH